MTRRSPVSEPPSSSPLTCSLATACAARRRPPEPEAAESDARPRPRPRRALGRADRATAASAETRRARRSSPTTTVDDFESVGWTCPRRTVPRRRDRDPRRPPVRLGATSRPGRRSRADLRLGADRRRMPRRRAGRISSSQGWTRENAADGVFVTESPETTHRDRRRGLRHDLPLRRRLGEVRRHQAGSPPHRVAARLIPV